jgi:hypothetical protein
MNGQSANNAKKKMLLLIKNVRKCLFIIVQDDAASSYPPNISSPFLASLLDTPSLVHLESVRSFFHPLSPLLYYPANLKLHM